MQYSLIAPTSGNTWQFQMQYLYSAGGPACIHNTGTYTSGLSPFMEIVYSSTHGWLAVDPSFSYIYSAFCTNVSALTVFGANGQEPFAFESYDSTGGDFNSLLISSNPIFQYSADGGSTWTNAPAAFVVDANGLAGWGSYVIGSNVATPANVVEAGFLQSCSGASLYQLYLGSTSQSPLSSTCGTNTNLDELL